LPVSPNIGTQHVALATLDQLPALKLFATVDVLKDRPRLFVGSKEAHSTAGQLRTGIAG